MIHKYKQLGQNIVLDVYSGSVHVIDDVFYDMLDFIEEPFSAENYSVEYFLNKMEFYYYIILL